MAGALYHRERLVHLTIALPPPNTLENLRGAVKMIFRAVRRRYRDQGVIAYRAAWVWEDGHPHAHILTNMPYVSQKWLYKRLAAYLETPAHVNIKRIPTDDRKEMIKRVGYLSQYMANQAPGSLVHYSHSDDWLPAGYEDEWRSILDGLRAAHGLNILEAPEWRAAAVLAMDDWIEEQRRARQQTALVGGLSSRVGNA